MTAWAILGSNPHRLSASSRFARLCDLVNVRIASSSLSFLSVLCAPVHPGCTQ
jgi:hypothetical protein